MYRYLPQYDVKNLMIISNCAFHSTGSVNVSIKHIIKILLQYGKMIIYENYQ